MRLVVALSVLLFAMVGCKTSGGSAVKAGDPAYSRQVGEYAIDTSVDTNFTDFLLLMNGWSCTTRSTLNYKESERNHDGKMTELSHASTANWSMWGGAAGAAPRMTVTRNFLHIDPIAAVRISQMCTRTNDVPCQDPQKKNCTETEELEVRWSCDFQNFPVNVGQAASQRCSMLPTSNWASNWSSLFLNSFRKLKIQANIKLLSMRSIFDFDNCEKGTPNSYYLRVTQGLDGHVGENDFKVKLNIDGKDMVNEETPTGLVSMAVSYCPDKAQDDIVVNLSGIEKDLIWDDVYNPDGQSKDMRLKRGQSKVYGLTRKGLIRTYQSKVLVEVFDQNIK